MTKKQVVSKAALEKARAKRNIKFTDYGSYTVDFKSGIQKTPEEQKDYARLWRQPKIYSSVLEVIGHTPMIRLTRFAELHGIECELLAKVEFFNPGGSIKDRIGLEMFEEAEKSGRIKPGDTIIEATTGNTGAAMSMVASLKGYNMVITMPQRMSQEKLCTMEALGAEVVRTQDGVAWNNPDSHIGLSIQLAETLERAHILDQYKNASNPRSHYLYTAEEILYQCDDKVDMVVMTTGTGGTLTGIAAKLKERNPSCKVIGVDPHGSSLAQPASLNSQAGKRYHVEGIGYDFVPSTLDRGLVDEWVKTDDDETFKAARELVLYEGLLVGGSSGAAAAGMLKVIRQLKRGQRCVLVFADSARNYITKFMSNAWMLENGFQV